MTPSLTRWVAPRGLGDPVVQRAAFFHGRVESRQRVKDGPEKVAAFTSRQGLDFDPEGKGGVYFHETRPPAQA